MRTIFLCWEGYIYLWSLDVCLCYMSILVCTDLHLYRCVYNYTVKSDMRGSPKIALTWLNLIAENFKLVLRKWILKTHVSSLTHHRSLNLAKPGCVLSSKVFLFVPGFSDTSVYIPVYTGLCLCQFIQSWVYYAIYSINIYGTHICCANLFMLGYIISC